MEANNSPYKTTSITEENPYGINFFKSFNKMVANGKRVEYGYYFERNKKMHWVCYFMEGKDCACKTMTKTTMERRAIKAITEFFNA